MTKEQRAVLAEVRRLGRKKPIYSSWLSSGEERAYNNGWVSACQELESRLLEMFGKKEAK